MKCIWLRINSVFSAMQSAFFVNLALFSQWGTLPPIWTKNISLIVCFSLFLVLVSLLSSLNGCRSSVLLMLRNFLICLIKKFRLISLKTFIVALSVVKNLKCNKRFILLRSLFSGKSEFSVFRCCGDLFVCSCVSMSKSLSDNYEHSPPRIPKRLIALFGRKDSGIVCYRIYLNEPFLFDFNINLRAGWTIVSNAHRRSFWFGLMYLL